MIKPIQMLIDRQFLTKETAEAVMEEILADADPIQVAAFLSILKYRGEAAHEIVGMVSALQKKAVPVELPCSAIDIVGTGGDMAHTVNISTGSAILTAACGIPVAKHGNRSVSSRCGSADVLEAMGISVESSPEEIIRSIQQVNIAFMFAPYYHPTLKKLGSVRRSLKLPTVINLLGPLLNPSTAEYALIGVADPSKLELMSDVMQEMPHRKRTLLFHGCGLDELTPLGKVIAYEIRDGKKQYLEIDPAKLGFSPCTLRDLQGGETAFNALLLQEALSGSNSAIADSLIFTAGAAVWIFGKSNSLTEGVQIARQALKEGLALKVLNEWKIFSRTKE